MTTSTPPSLSDAQAAVEAKQEEIAALATRQNEAANNAGAWRARHAQLDGQAGIGRATEAQVADAAQAVDAAEKEERRLARSMEILKEELAAAEAAAGDAARAELLATHAGQYAGWRKAVGRVDRRLATVGADMSEVADYEHELRSNRAELTALLDREPQVREQFRREYERLVREAPPGQVPNVDTLERRQNEAIAAAKADVAREVDELLPLPDPAELDAILAKHDGLASTLIGPELRRALAEGDEFVRRPEIVGLGNSFIGQTSQRIYAAHEGPAAEARYSALVSALARLKGSTTAPTLAQITSGGAEPTVVMR